MKFLAAQHSSSASNALPTELYQRAWEGQLTAADILRLCFISIWNHSIFFFFRQHHSFAFAVQKFTSVCILLYVYLQFSLHAVTINFYPALFIPRFSSYSSLFLNEYPLHFFTLYGYFTTFFVSIFWTVPAPYIHINDFIIFFYK